MTQRADLVVFGAGVAGLAAATTAARAGLDTILLAGPARASRDIPETLAPQALPLLGTLGLDEVVIARSFPAVALRLSRWGLGAARYVPAMMSIGGLALILGKADLVELMRAHAQAVGVRLVETGRVVSAREQPGGVALEVDGAGAGDIHADFAIDATGRAAAFAQSLGVRKRVLDNLVSFWIAGVAAAEGQRVIGTVTVRDGWLFYAGQPDGSAALGFFTAGSAVGRKPTGGEIIERAVAVSELRPLIGDVGGWRAAPVITRNAATTLLEQFGGAHWLACGDALQTVDPLGSSGIHTAVNQGMQAAHAALASLDGDQRPRLVYETLAAEQFRDFQNRRRAYYGHGVYVPAPSDGARAAPSFAGMGSEGGAIY